MTETTPASVPRMQKIAVIGLGFVGLPLALLIAKKGFSVIGIDVDHNKVKHLNKHVSYIPDISNQEIKEAAESGRFSAVDSYPFANQADVVIICVPTPLSEDHTPDLHYLHEVGHSLVPYLKQGQLVILESSTYPGTTRKELQPILEKSGLKAGTGFFLAYSPERIDPGNKHIPVEAIPKVISGITEQCKKQIFQLYSLIYQQVIPVSSTEAAEMTKLLENTFRFVNISFINEMAILCDQFQLDVWEIIKASDSKPYGFMAFYPGPGIGGHCIPVDPLYLQWIAQQMGASSLFIELADQVNHIIIDYITRKLTALFVEKKAHILIYGAAYKKDINDVRESSIFSIIRNLTKANYQVSYHDPYIPEMTVEGAKMSSIPLTEENLGQADCVLILTDHTQIPIQFILDHAKLVYDTRNITAGLSGNAKIIRLGGGDE